MPREQLQSRELRSSGTYQAEVDVPVLARGYVRCQADLDPVDLANPLLGGRLAVSADRRLLVRAVWRGFVPPQTPEGWPARVRYPPPPSLDVPAALLAGKRLRIEVTLDQPQRCGIAWEHET